jgi:hypothetical protein
MFLKQIAKHEDIRIIMELYEMRREPRLRQGRDWMAQQPAFKTLDDWKKFAPGTEENASLRMVTTYWEMVASFLTSGALHKELFFQSGMELLFCWEKIKDVVAAVRDMNKNPYQFKNLEEIAGEFKTYLDGAGPETYAAFAKRARRE